MKIAHICPECGVPAIYVDDKAVIFQVKTIDLLPKGKKWSACPNPDCEIAYFTKGNQIFLKDLKTKLFYKNSNSDVPICYCSDLTRGEIHKAVKAGCNNIDEVQEYTGKNITGFCEEKNPLGKCCRNIFLFEIKQAGNKFHKGDTSNF